MEINPYITFHGNCEAAMTRYQQIFGGEITTLMRFREMPGWEDRPEPIASRVAHARLEFLGRAIMGSDGTDTGNPPPPEGFHVNLAYDDLAEAQRVFDALAEDGQVLMPFSATFWAAGFGMLRDRFGVPWMINCDVDKGPGADTA